MRAIALLIGRHALNVANAGELAILLPLSVTSWRMTKMYNLKDRSYFTTLGELRMLLNDFADEVTVCVGGSLVPTYM